MLWLFSKTSLPDINKYLWNVSPEKEKNKEKHKRKNGVNEWTNWNISQNLNKQPEQEGLLKCWRKWPTLSNILKESFIQNENSVIIYSSSCHSKPICCFSMKNTKERFAGSSSRPQMSRFSKNKTKITTNTAYNLPMAHTHVSQDIWYHHRQIRLHLGYCSTTDGWSSPSPMFSNLAFNKGSIDALHVPLVHFHDVWFTFLDLDKHCYSELLLHGKELCEDSLQILLWCSTEEQMLNGSWKKTHESV